MNNKLDVNPPVFALSSSSYSDLETDRRLIVLVPDSEADTSKVGRKIWELANALEGNVQFLGLSMDEAHEPALRRQIIAMSTMVEDENISVESKIESGGNWLDFVKSNWNNGDVLLCFAESHTGLANRPLSQILETKLKATVYVIPELQLKRHRPGWMSSVMGWVGSIGIILGFLWLQIRFTQFPKDAIYTVLLYLSIFVEAGSIWIWNSLFE